MKLLTSVRPCTFLFFALGMACQRKEAVKVEAVRLPEVSVKTHAATAHKVPSLLPLTGELIAERRTKLSANATGQVVETFVERGQHVGAKQVLVRLDVRGAEHTMAEARANVANIQAQRAVAEKDCERTRSLGESGAISRQEYDRSMAQCQEIIAQSDAAQARLRSAQKTISDGLVRAPFAGRITSREVDVGDYVQPSSSVAVLIQPDPIRLRFTVPEASCSNAKSGSKVTFTVSAVTDRVFEGVVKYVSGEVRPETRDVVIEALVDNHDELLLPGMFATVNLVTGEQELPTVPKTAILDLGDHPAVMTVRNQRIEQHAVRLGSELGDRIAIEAGVNATDQVVDVADANITDGARVKVGAL